MDESILYKIFGDYAKNSNWFYEKLTDEMSKNKYT